MPGTVLVTRETNTVSTKARSLTLWSVVSKERQHRFMTATTVLWRDAGPQGRTAQEAPAEAWPGRRWQAKPSVSVSALDIIRDKKSNSNGHKEQRGFTDTHK